MPDFRFLDFCREDTVFYDRSGQDPADHDYRVELAPGWTLERGREWTVCTPPALAIPGQGWKIHVSALPDRAAETLDVVAPYCVRSGLMFKYISNPEILGRRSSKYGDRTASGKFITIYPPDDRELERTLRDLDDRIGGTPAPYILSDLRWKAGPLYVRYGAFVLKLARTEDGSLVPGIEDPEGRLVPDVRRPAFRPPEWVTPPEFLTEALEARRRGALKDFPFRVHRALHFSNGGGVYRARDTRTGDDVLLKEARPLAGLDASGVHAIDRMEREHWALSRLAGLACVPALVDYRDGHEHRFLAREFVDGEPLIDVLRSRHPLVNGENTPQARAAYTAWALDILDQIAAGVRAMHDRGVVFGDLHPGNVLVKPDGTIAFIDLETATAIEAGHRQAMGALGYYAPGHLRGADIDLYSLAVLRLTMFVPMPQMIQWGRGRVRQLVEVARAQFDLPADLAADIERELDRLLPPGPDYSVRWPADPLGGDLRTRIADSIVSVATPDRDDRLYPGDAMQFLLPGGGVTLAYGAAGVLWALAQGGHEPPAEHVAWLVERIDRQPDAGPGFYTGLAGLAYALEELGHPDPATSVLDAAIAVPPDGVTTSLLDGWSGLGLTALHFARTRRDSGYLEFARDLARRVGARTPEPRGLLRGRTGHALFLLRLFQHTDESGYLDAAVRELRADLDALDLDGPDAARRLALLPGLAGTAGIAMVTRAILAEWPDEGLRRAHERLLPMLRAQHAVPGGLFNGRSAAVLALAGEGDVAGLAAHLDVFGWEAVSTEPGRVHFIGQHGYRLSTDLATGSAGVLLALEAAARTDGPSLPFLAPDRAVVPA